MAHQIDLNPASHLTIGTVGPPGMRTFFLQGSRGSQVISLVIEKEQAILLGSSLESFVAELERNQPSATRETSEQSVWLDMRLREPVEELFRVGNMGLGYSEDHDLVVVIAYELVEEGVDPNVVSFWASRSQIQSLINHIDEVVRQGRPICGNCGRPIDPDGHFCPNRNGHRH
ncbi:MAG: DUF3090 domain-containing protein [Chloroflexota bacterium]|jgi:uncharacterized repeat protein (TIGR03847 family)